MRDRWAVQLQFKHGMDSKLDSSLLVAAGMDLASPEHLPVAYRASVQGALQKAGHTVELPSLWSGAWEGSLISDQIWCCNLSRDSVHTVTSYSE